MEHIRESRDKIQEKLIDNKIDKLRLDKIPEMEQASGLIRENNEVLGVVLDLENEVDFIKKLETVAEETGNKISLKIEDQNDNQGKKRATASRKNEEEDIKDSLKYDNHIAMQITLEGRYANLVSFIRKIESDAHYMNVISMEISKIEDSEREQKNSSSGAQDVLWTGEAVQNDKAPEVSEKKSQFLRSIINLVVYTKK